MKTVKTFARQLSFSLMMAMTLGSAIVSCGSILDEEDVDCSVEYRVKFKYDYNMKYADAFSREVGTVTLYAFDDNGKLVYQKTEEGDVLGEDGYTMKVDLMKQTDIRLGGYIYGSFCFTFSCIQPYFTN